MGAAWSPPLPHAQAACRHRQCHRQPVAYVSAPVVRSRAARDALLLLHGERLVLSPQHVLRPWQHRLTALAAAQVGLRATSPVAASAARGLFERSSPDRAVSRSCTPVGASCAPPALRGACACPWLPPAPPEPPGAAPERTAPVSCRHSLPLLLARSVDGGGLWLSVTRARAARPPPLLLHGERLVIAPPHVLRRAHASGRFPCRVHRLERFQGAPALVAADPSGSAAVACGWVSCARVPFAVCCSPRAMSGLCSALSSC